MCVRTVAEETGEMPAVSHIGSRIREMQPAQAQVRVHVTRVEFDPNDSISADAQEEISEELRRRVFKPDADSAYQKDLANEIAEVPVREHSEIGLFSKLLRQPS